MKTYTLVRRLFLTFFCLGPLAGAAEHPYVGRWALTIPGGGAGWLGVEQQGGPDQWRETKHQIKAAAIE